MNGTTLELIISLLPTILGVGGVISAFTFVMAYVANSKKQALIQSDTERWKQMTDENRYLTSKNNYLEMKFKKVDEMFEDIQLQINSLSSHVCDNVINDVNHTPKQQRLESLPKIKEIEIDDIDDYNDETMPVRYANPVTYSHRKPMKGKTIGLTVGVDY